jgi:hypothetical protein
MSNRRFRNPIFKNVSIALLIAMLLLGQAYTFASADSAVASAAPGAELALSPAEGLASAPAAEPASAPFANVAVFDDSAYVDTTSSSPSAESDNIQATLSTSLGHTVSTFTGVDQTSWANGLSGKNLVVIPELEVDGNLAGDLTAGAITQIQNFVGGGGGLIISASSLTRDEDFLNTVFSFSMVNNGGGTVSNFDSTAAAGTAFAGGPATLPNNNGNYSTVTANLPIGSKSIYNESTRSYVVLMTYGSGKIVFLSYDWYDAIPVGGQDGGWVDMLDRAVHEVMGTVATPDIQVTMTESAIWVSPGTNVLNYVVTASNIGPVGATGVHVQNTLSLPAGVTLASATPSGSTTYNSGSGDWNIGNLGSGGSATLSLWLSVDAAAPSGSNVIQNAASLWMINEADSNSGNNSASQYTSITNPNPVITGAATADDWRVIRSGANLLVYNPSASLWRTYDFAGLTSLTINAGTGNDKLTVDFSVADPIPPNGITFNGGTGSDTLFYQGPATSSMTYNFVNENDGSVVHPYGTVTYTGLNPIVSTITAAIVNLNYSDVAETITVQDSGTAGQTQVDSNVGGETVTFNNPTTTLNIYTGNVGTDTNPDTITVNGYGSGFAASTNLYGYGGDDTFNLYAAVTNINGGNDEDALNIYAGGQVTNQFDGGNDMVGQATGQGDSIWRFASAGTFNMTGAYSGNGTGVNSYVNVEELYGHDGQIDTYNLNGGYVDFINGRNPFSSSANGDVLNNNTVIGYTFHLRGGRSGDYTIPAVGTFGFDHLEDINGSDGGNDSFYYDSNDGSNTDGRGGNDDFYLNGGYPYYASNIMHGGTGYDTLYGTTSIGSADWYMYGSNYLRAEVSSGTWRYFNGIDGLVGRDTNDYLYNYDTGAGATFNITGAGDGSVPTWGFDFTDFYWLLGHNGGVDVFNLSGGTMNRISGSGGSDQLISTMVRLLVLSPISMILKNSTVRMVAQIPSTSTRTVKCIIFMAVLDLTICTTT